MITDVPAVRDADGQAIPTLRMDGVRALLEAGTASGGMIPKLEAATSALAAGAASAWIGDLDGIARPGAPGAGTRLIGRRGPVPTSLPLLPLGGSER